MARREDASVMSRSTVTRRTRHVLRHIPRKAGIRRETFKQDTLAGLTGAIGSVPDGMASGILAGVNPVYGLYGSIAGPSVGGLFVSTRLMLVTTTSAAALAAGATLSSVPADQRAAALFLLTMLVGVVQVAAGLLRLGRFTRFVSHSVMVGFLTGVAVLIVLGQLPPLVGYEAEGSNKVTQTINLLAHLGQVSWRSTIIGATAIVLVIVLPRTRLGPFGTLVALVVSSLLMLALGWESVEIVSDVSAIPDSLPLPVLPELSLLSFDVITGALAIAAIILVQGAGVSQGTPNPDGSLSSFSQDFVAQGTANLASGAIQGMPVGGSVGQTALNVTAGARSQWAAISSGIWMLIIVGLLASLVAEVAMPALAGLLIYAGYRTIDLHEAISIWQTGWASRIAIGSTFIFTLFLPIQAAVGIGVVISALFYLNASSTDVSLVELRQFPDGRIEERPAPDTLPIHAITILGIYGSVFYAGAYTLQRDLPRPLPGSAPAVVIRLRGRTKVGATFVEVLADYARRISEAGGALYLSGVDEHVQDQFVRTSKLALDGPVSIYRATDILGDSSRRALADANTWLVQHQDQPPEQEHVTINERTMPRD